MTDHRQPNSDNSLAAPERFTRALADLAPPAIVVSSAVDDAILREARNRLQPGAVKTSTTTSHRRMMSSEAFSSAPGANEAAPTGARTILSAGRGLNTRDADKTVRAPLRRLLGNRLWAWLSRTLKIVFFQPPRRMAWAAATAVVLLAGWLAQWSFSPRSPVAAADVNRDGRVDILDALALAQQVERGARLTRELDFNRDGVVDRRDADAIGMQAVRETPGEPL